MNGEVKEGRAPFPPLFWPQIESRRKAAALSPIRFRHKRGGEGRPRSFHPSSVLATNRVVKEGRVPFTPRL